MMKIVQKSKDGFLTYVKEQKDDFEDLQQNNIHAIIKVDCEIIVKIIRLCKKKQKNN